MSCRLVPPGDENTNKLTTYTADFSTIVTTSSEILRKSNGAVLSLLTDIYTGPLESAITALKTQNLLLKASDFETLLSLVNQPTPATPSSPTQQQELETRNSKLLKHLQHEYYFYMCRYRNLYNLYAQVYGAANNAAVTPLIQNIPDELKGREPARLQYLTLQLIAGALEPLNTKLRKLSELSAAINNDAIGLITNYRQANGTTNAALEEAIQKLNTSADNSTIQSVEQQRRALEFTKEKNRYSNLYLGIYAFLNISALAIILHIATS